MSRQRLRRRRNNDLKITIMKTKQIIKGMVLMLATVLMTPGIFAQNYIQKEKKEQNINKVDKSKKQEKVFDQSKIQRPVKEPVPRPIQEIIGLDENGNPIRRPGGNNAPPKSKLQEKWAETNCGKQPYGDYYELTQNPCPGGYKKPTIKDFQELIDENEWIVDKTTSDNPGKVNGVWYGESKDAVRQATASDPKGCIFFPFSGHYLTASNKVISKDEGGSYASSEYEMRDNNKIYYYLWIERNHLSGFTVGKAKMTVRCVRF